MTDRGAERRQCRAGAQVVSRGSDGGVVRERRYLSRGRAPGPSPKESPEKSYWESPKESLCTSGPTREVGPGEREVMTSALLRARRRSSERFLKGPIPVSTIAAAVRLPSRFALPVLLAIRYCVDVAGKPWVSLSAKTLAAFGFDQDAKARALRELEGAGLVRVKRPRGGRRWCLWRPIRSGAPMPTDLSTDTRRKLAGILGNGLEPRPHRTWFDASAGWPRGLREDLAAEYVGLSVTMLRAKVAAGELAPPQHASPGRIIYLRDHLDAYLDRLFAAGDAAGGNLDPVAEWDAACDLGGTEVSRRVRNARGKMVTATRREGVRRRLLGDDGRPVNPSDHAALALAWQRAHERYQAADQAASAAADARAVRTRSIADVIRLYRASDEWEDKQPATRRDYEKGLVPLERDWGHLPIIGLQKHHVAKIRSRYAWREAKAEGGEVGKIWNGRQANRIVTVLSILLTFSIDALGWRQDNPALRPKRLQTQGDGYRPWKLEEFAQFCDRAAADWRFAALLALLSGQRGQDQVAMRWADYDGAGLHVVQQKGRQTVKLWIECHPALQAALNARRAALEAAAVPVLHPAERTILTRPDGAPWTANAFQKAAGQAIRAAGLTGIVWHGLRGAAASWAADGGATEKGIQSLLGHRSAAASQRYMRGADQRRLAGATARAIALPFENTAGTYANKAGTETVSRKRLRTVSHPARDC